MLSEKLYKYQRSWLETLWYWKFFYLYMFFGVLQCLQGFAFDKIYKKED